MPELHHPMSDPLALTAMAVISCGVLREQRTRPLAPVVITFGVAE